jgi:hypothetical protein
MAVSRRKVAAYAFIRDTDVAPTAFVTGVLDVPGVRFAARTLGEHSAFVAVETGSLGALQDVVAPGVRGAGGRGVEWSVVPRSAYASGHPVKTFIADTGALVRAACTDPRAVIDTVIERIGYLNELEDGSSVGAVEVVGGSARVIIDICSPTEAGLVAALAALNDLPTTTHTHVALAVYPGNAGTSPA